MNSQRIAIITAVIMSASISMNVARAQPADLQPGVQTSADAATGPGPAAVPPTAAGTPAQSAGTPRPPSMAPAATVSAAVAAAGRANDSRSAASAGKAAADGVDRIELGTTEISGNRELPKLMYIVPWQRDQLGKFVGRPPNSLVDEALTPVDRQVFQRQNRYYAALQAGLESVKSQPGTPQATAAAARAKDEK
jgi:hypothetical protein